MKKYLALFSLLLLVLSYAAPVILAVPEMYCDFDDYSMSDCNSFCQGEGHNAGGGVRCESFADCQHDAEEMGPPPPDCVYWCTNAYGGVLFCWCCPD